MGRKKKSNPEHDVQAAVFSWKREIGVYLFPELELFHASQAGQPRWGAQRNYYKAEGLEDGYPDTHLPISRGGYCSLWIEFKAPGKKSGLRDNQKEKIRLLQNEGNLVFLCDDKDEAILALTHYCLGYYGRTTRSDWRSLSPLVY